MIRWCIALVAAAFLAGASCKQRASKQTAEAPASPEIWFGDLKEHRVDATTAADVVRSIWSHLAGGSRTIPDANRPTMLFVSTSNAKRSQVVLGVGRTLKRAVESAIALAKADTPAPLRWLKVDFVTRVARGYKYAPAHDGLVGVAFSRKSRSAIVPGVVMLASRSKRKTFERDAKFSFHTSEHFYDAPLVVPMFRGHARSRELTRPALLAAARSAGRYLVRMRHDNGKFIYSYDAARNRDRGSYNLVRHAGTIYSMLQLYRVKKDEKLLAAANESINYLLGFVKPFRGAMVLKSKDRIKLGGVALVAVALIEHVRATGSKQHLKVAQQLCSYMVSAQRKDGSFVHSRKFPGGEERDFRSQYYPGEAMLGLLRTHSVDKNPKWLDAAERAARYLITVRDKGKATSELIHDHWLLYALNELYRARKKPLYLTHASRIAQAITDSQLTKSVPEDYVGGYRPPPRSTPAATRSEGLLAAHSLIREFGDQQLAKRIRRAVEMGVGFQLHTQITRERAMYFRDPRRGLGGFTRSLTNFEVRIDYVQHNISALILLHQLLAP